MSSVLNENNTINSDIEFDYYIIRGKIIHIDPSHQISTDDVLKLIFSIKDEDIKLVRYKGIVYALDITMIDENNYGDYDSQYIIDKI